MFSNTYSPLCIFLATKNDSYLRTNETRGTEGGLVLLDILAASHRRAKALPPAAPAAAQPSPGVLAGPGALKPSAQLK